MVQKPLWRSVLFGALAACMDETIQRFVPDRGPAIKDVLIDTAGVCVGVGILCLYVICKKRKLKEKVI